MSQAEVARMTGRGVLGAFDKAPLLVWLIADREIVCPRSTRQLPVSSSTKYYIVKAIRGMACLFVCIHVAGPRTLDYYIRKTRK
jgi:hypothetical protein